MHGWFNNIIENYVISQSFDDESKSSGDTLWLAIKVEAGCDIENRSWVFSQDYPDELTFKLLSAAATKLKLSEEQLLSRLGSHFMSYSSNKGYDDLLGCQGRSFVEFLKNINEMHSHIKFAIDNRHDTMSTFPIFYCEEDEQKGLVLHYYSKRGPKLAPFVVGSLQHVAQKYFNSSIKMQLFQTQGENDSEFTSWTIQIEGGAGVGGGGRGSSSTPLLLPAGSSSSREIIGRKKSADTLSSSLTPRIHGEGEGGAAVVTKAIDSSSASAKEDDDDEKKTSTAPGTGAGLAVCPFSRNIAATPRRGSPHQQYKLAADPPSSSSSPRGRQIEYPYRDSELMFRKRINRTGGLSGDMVQTIFPFHISVNRNFEITHMGDKVAHFVPGITIGSRIDEWFSIKLPEKCRWNWADISIRAGTSQVTLELEDSKKIDCTNEIVRRLSGGLYFASDPRTSSSSSSSSRRRGAQGEEGKQAESKETDSKNDDDKDEDSNHHKEEKEDEEEDDGLFSALFLVQPEVDTYAEMRESNVTLSDFPRHSAQQKLIKLTESLQTETYLGEKSLKDVAQTRKLLEMKLTFVRYISHEIRTPLNTVSMGLRLVQSMTQALKESNELVAQGGGGGGMNTVVRAGSGGGNGTGVGVGDSPSSVRRSADEEKERLRLVLATAVATAAAVPTTDSGRIRPPSFVAASPIGSSDGSRRATMTAAITSSSTTTNPLAIDSARLSQSLTEIFAMTDEIRESCDIAVDILDNLLMYEKLEGEALDIERQSLPIVQLIYGAVKNFLGQARQAEIELECSFDGMSFPPNELDSPSVYVEIDRQKVCHILRNLLSNAMKYMPTQNEVEAGKKRSVTVHVSQLKKFINANNELEDIVSPALATAPASSSSSSSSSGAPAKEEEGKDDDRDDAKGAGREQKQQEVEQELVPSADSIQFVRIQVIDSGLGLAEEDQQRIFEQVMHFDLKNLQGGGRGSGLGLFIARAIMDLHGGTIGVFSGGLGKGSCFYVDIPISTEAQLALGRRDGFSSGLLLPTEDDDDVKEEGPESPLTSVLPSSSDKKKKQQQHQQEQQQENERMVAASPPTTAGRVKARGSSLRKSKIGGGEGGGVLADWKSPSSAATTSAANTHDAQLVVKKHPPHQSSVSRNASSFSMSRNGSALTSQKSVKSMLMSPSLRTLTNSIKMSICEDKIMSSQSLLGVPDAVNNNHRIEEETEGEEEDDDDSDAASEDEDKFDLPNPTRLLRGLSDGTPGGGSGAATPGGASGGGAAVAAPPKLASGQLNILVVDDSIATRKMVVRFLKMSKICDNPIEASDGSEAFELVHSTMMKGDSDDVHKYPPFDGILMDFVMPIMDGPTATQNIRELGYEGLIVGLTGNVLSQDRAYFKAKGANHVLTKPADMQKLATVLRRIPRTKSHSRNFSKSGGGGGGGGGSSSTRQSKTSRKRSWQRVTSPLLADDPAAPSPKQQQPLPPPSENQLLSMILSPALPKSASATAFEIPLDSSTGISAAGLPNKPTTAADTTASSSIVGAVTKSVSLLAAAAGGGKQQQQQQPRRPQSSSYHNRLNRLLAGGGGGGGGGAQEVDYRADSKRNENASPQRPNSSHARVPTISPRSAGDKSGGGTRAAASERASLRQRMEKEEKETSVRRTSKLSASQAAAAAAAAEAARLTAAIAFDKQSKESASISGVSSNQMVSPMVNLTMVTRQSSGGQAVAGEFPALGNNSTGEGGSRSPVRPAGGTRPGAVFPDSPVRGLSADNLSPSSRSDRRASSSVGFPGFSAVTSFLIRHVTALVPGTGAGAGAGTGTPPGRGGDAAVSAGPDDDEDSRSRRRSLPSLFGGGRAAAAGTRGAGAGASSGPNQRSDGAAVGGGGGGGGSARSILQQNSVQGPTMLSALFGMNNNNPNRVGPESS